MAVRAFITLLIFVTSLIARENRPFGKLIPTSMYGDGKASFLMPNVPVAFSFNKGCGLSSSLVEYYLSHEYCSIKEALINFSISNSKISLKSSVSLLNAEPYRENRFYISLGYALVGNLRVGVDFRVEYATLEVEDYFDRLGFTPSFSAAFKFGHVNMVFTAGDVKFDRADNRQNFMQDLSFTTGVVSDVSNVGSAGIIFIMSPWISSARFTVLVNGKFNINRYLSLLTAVRSEPFIVDLGVSIRFLKRLNISISSVTDPNLGGSLIVGYSTEIP